MKTKLVYALAGAIALGFTTFSHAEDKPEGRPQRGNYSPEQKEKFARDLGLNPDDLKNLPPEERMAKLKEAGEKKRAELEKKKADGTITEQEKETLQRMENFKKMREQRGGGAFGGQEDKDKMAKDLGLNPDDLKNLSQAERGAKIREAAKAKYAELQKKQTDGTITDSEKEVLKRMEQRHKQMQGDHGEHGPRHGGKDGKAADEKK